MKEEEIRVRGAKKLKTELTNISDNLGVSIASLVKPALRQLVDSYPEHLKNPKPKN